jgi:hypothetical protein
MILDDIIRNYPESEFLKADGFDSAVIGLEESSGRLIYSVQRIVHIMMSEGETEEDALEYYYYNMEGAYVGEKTPIYCFDLLLD